MCTLLVTGVRKKKNKRVQVERKDVEEDLSYKKGLKELVLTKLTVLLRVVTL